MKSNLDPFEVERMRTQYDLAACAARDTPMLAVSGGFKGKCPLPDHEDETESFNVNTEKNLFFCYGCQRGGDIFKYLSLMHGLNTEAAIKWLENPPKP
jgi:DNA primase